MRQLVMKASYNVGFGTAAAIVSLGGQGDTGPFTTFGADAAKVVVPLAGTLQTLTARAPGGTATQFVVTLMVNGAATALTCTIPSGGTTASDPTHVVPVAPGDDAYLAVTVTPPGSGVGYPLTVSLEFEGTAQWYGVAPEGGGGQTAGTTNTGGALGNGIQQTGAVTTALSNTYSLCTTAGTATGLRLKTFAGPPGAGTWLGYLIKNQVLQDGTAGTVDTTTTLTGAATQASAAFALPLAVGDHVDVALRRTGTNAPFANAQVALSTTFVPADGQSFMCCGGSNDANSPTAVDWKWVQSQQLSVSEAVAQVPTGPRGWTATGLYVEASVAPGAGKSRVFTLRHNGADTAVTCTISGTTATTCQTTGQTVPFAPGDLADLQITPVGGPATSIGLHWGILFAPPPPIPPPPPPPPGAVQPIRRLRQAPHLWDGTSGHRLKYPGFQLLVEAGAPRDTDGPMSWVLQWSDDGGHSWSHEHRIEGSRLGEHTFRFWWRRLGQSRDRVFRVVNSDDAKIVIIDALLVPDPVEGSS